MRYMLLRAMAMACCGLASVVAGAAESETTSGNPITLGEAVKRTLASHPALAAFPFELQAQEARGRQAALRPSPELDLLVEDIGGTGDRSGFDTAQTTLSLSQIIELGGKRDARGEVAKASLDRQRTEHAARQLDIVAEVARRFVATLAQQSRVVAAREAVGLAESTAAAVDRRVRAAAAPEAESARASVAVAEAQLELEDALHDLSTRRHALAAAIGVAEPDFGEVQGDLLALPDARAFDGLIAQLKATPDFLRFADEERLRDAELRLAQRQQRADLRATVGIRRYETGDDMGFVAGIGLPLFASKRAAPQIAIAQAERDRIGFERDAAFLKAQHQLYAQYQEMEHARHVSGVLRDEVLPQLQKALEKTRYAYERGRYSYLEWADAQQRLLNARTRLIDTAADFHNYRIDIERLTGESLGAAGDRP
ncbi:TolC family protein [Hydrocarboniphaga effusa]|uniref:TolC family protein n=1 Tax=Hydrocarboniphaga effusa TaxID=243629 RepID=UPI0035AFA285